MIRNKFGGKCGECGQRVDVGAGFVTGPPWHTWCPAHAPEEAARATPRGDADDGERRRAPDGPPAVRVEPHEGDQVRVAPAQFLGDKFEDFKAATREGGATYDFEKRVNLAPARALPELLAALKGAGFQVVLEPSLAANLQAAASAARQASAAADARIEEIRGRLAARGRRLWNFQEGGVTFLAEHLRGGAVLGDDMGLGKTIQALLALPEHAAAIVVCPKNVKLNWARECRSWRPDLHPTVLDGLNALGYWPRPGELLAVAYPGLGDAAPAGTPAPGTVLISDEAHRLKNARTRQRERWDLVRDAVLAAGGAAWGLTGSPLVNELDELWSVFEASGKLGEATWGTKKNFKKSALGDPDGYRRKVRQVMLRRERNEVLKDLPPIVYQDVPVEISKETRAELDHVLAAMVAEAANKSVQDLRRTEEYGKLPLEVAKAREDAIRAAASEDAEAAIELAFDGRLPIPFELISRCKALLALAKAPAAVEVLADMLGDSAAPPVQGSPGALWTGGRTYDDPVVFASAHLEPLRLVAGERTGWGLITGEVADTERDRLIQKFQAGGLEGMGLSIRAGGEGITLTRASRMLENDPEWTPAAMDQLEARLRRIGATGVDRDGTGQRTILVVRLVADHVIDRRIHEILDEKRGLIEQFVQVASVAADHRAGSVAQQIDAALDGVQTAATVPGQSAFVRRPAKDDAERAALAWAAERAEQLAEAGTDPRTEEFLGSLARQARERGGLTDKQWAALATSHGRAVPAAAACSPPRTARERWAAQALAQLAGNDPDHARQQNDVGFNRYDNALGHELAGLLAERGGLPRDRWAQAVKLVWKYQRQVGPAPAAEPAATLPPPPAQEVPAAAAPAEAPAPPARASTLLDDVDDDDLPF